MPQKKPLKRLGMQRVRLQGPPQQRSSSALRSPKIEAAEASSKEAKRSYENLNRKAPLADTNPLIHELRDLVKDP